MNKPEREGFATPGPSRSGCKELSFDSVLSSVEQQVVAQLKIGDVLEVRREIYQARIVVLVYHNGGRAGSVTGPYVADLLACLEKGNRFSARVRSIDGGLVTVSIAPQE